MCVIGDFAPVFAWSDLKPLRPVFTGGRLAWRPICVSHSFLPAARFLCILSTGVDVHMHTCLACMNRFAPYFSTRVGDLASARIAQWQCVPLVVVPLPPLRRERSTALKERSVVQSRLGAYSRATRSRRRRLVRFFGGRGSLTGWSGAEMASAGSGVGRTLTTRGVCTSNARRFGGPSSFEHASWTHR